MLKSWLCRLNPQVEDIQRLRVEKMERQLANLTGLVQKALQVPGAAGAGPASPAPAPAAAPRQQFHTYQARTAPQGIFVTYYDEIHQLNNSSSVCCATQKQSLGV